MTASHSAKMPLVLRSTAIGVVCTAFLADASMKKLKYQALVLGLGTAVSGSYVSSRKRR
jgi:hypothetical protein